MKLHYHQNKRHICCILIKLIIILKKIYKIKQSSYRNKIYNREHSVLCSCV